MATSKTSKHDGTRSLIFPPMFLWLLYNYLAQLKRRSHFANKGIHVAIRVLRIMQAVEFKIFV